MDKLLVTLIKLQELLNEQEDVLVEEIKQLSLPKVNPVTLQCIADSKSRLLSSINYFDTQRRQIELQKSITTPYSENPKLANRWRTIVIKTKNLKELNYKSYLLLEMHMKKAQEFKKLVKDSGMMNSLYESDGQTENKTSGRVYNISI